MVRRRPWLRWLALELAITTILALAAVVYVSLFTGFGRLVDDPTDRPISEEIAAKAEPRERAAFVETFAFLAVSFSGFHLAGYLASRAKRRANGPPGASAWRRLCLILLLLGTFLFDWLQAWVTTLFDTVAPGSIEPLLAWIVVAGAFWPLVMVRLARRAWPTHSAVGVLVAIAAATVLSFLRQRVETSLLAAVPTAVWLLLDKGLEDDGTPAPGNDRPTEVAGGES